MSKIRINEDEEEEEEPQEPAQLTVTRTAAADSEFNNESSSIRVDETCSKNITSSLDVNAVNTSAVDGDDEDEDDVEII